MLSHTWAGPNLVTLLSVRENTEFSMEDRKLGAAKLFLLEITKAID